MQAASAPDDKKAEPALEFIEKEVAAFQAETVSLLKILHGKMGVASCCLEIIQCVEAPRYNARFSSAKTYLPNIRDKALRDHALSKPTDIPELEKHYNTIASNIDKINAMHEGYIKLKFTDTALEVITKTKASTLEDQGKIKKSNDEKEVAGLFATFKAQQRKFNDEARAAMKRPKPHNSILADWDDERRFSIYHNVVVLIFGPLLNEAQTKLDELVHKKLLALKDLPYTKLENARMDIQAKLIKFKDELLTKIKKMYADEKTPNAMPLDLDSKLNNLWSTTPDNLNLKATYNEFFSGRAGTSKYVHSITDIEIAIKKYLVICELIQLIDFQNQKLNDMTVLQNCMLQLMQRLTRFDGSDRIKFSPRWNNDGAVPTDIREWPANASILLSAKATVPDSGESLVKSINKILFDSTGLLGMPAIEACITAYNKYLDDKIKNIDGFFARFVGAGDNPVEYIERTSNAEDKLLLMKAALLQQLADKARAHLKTVGEKITSITDFLNRVPSKIISAEEGTDFSDAFDDAKWTDAIALRNQIRQFTVAEIIALPRKNTDPKADSKGKDFLTQLNRILLMTAYATNSDEKSV